ncbi:MAG TPA: hypothetical protein VKU83_06470 [Puia sp.]|nr:hypothetical protein [Puia sp.]
MSETPITEEYLLANGWESRTFFYAIGGGEDEDDRLIFIKDGLALTEMGGFWYRADEDELEYRQGFPSQDRVYFIEEL